MAVMLRPNLIRQTVFLQGDAVIGTVLLDGIGMILMDNSIEINDLSLPLFAIEIQQSNFCYRIVTVTRLLPDGWPRKKESVNALPVTWSWKRIPTQVVWLTTLNHGFIECKLWFLNSSSRKLIFTRRYLFCR